MKKIIFVQLFLLSLSSYSQISLDIKSDIYLQNVQLNKYDVKYIEMEDPKINTQNKFSLYNLDGSLYKDISLPTKPDTSAYVQYIEFISTSLFDNDSTSIEYLVCYNWDSAGYGPKQQTQVVREDGTILLEEMDATPYYSLSSNPIFTTKEGTKMKLYYAFANHFFYQTKVFNLPGDPSSVEAKEKSNFFTIYPNPNNGSFFIKFDLQSGVDNTIELLSITGELIGRFRSSENPVKISNLGLSDGTYLITTKSKYFVSTNKMIIKK